MSLVYRYPGIRSFSSDPHERVLFQGRTRETRQLLHLVLAERLVVLYARSGMGKSSLIAAGVTHPLQDRGYCTVAVRFNDPATRTLDAVREQFGPDVERQGYEFVDGADASLWGWLKTCEVWRDDALLEPVLVLDQFEELFTLHGSEERVEFIRELAQVVRGNGPRDEEARLGTSAPKVRVLISMREDFLGRLEELAGDLPAIFENRFRIEPLAREQARRAITVPAELDDPAFDTPPFRFEEDAVEQMLDFLTSGDRGGQRGSVEPFQLQLICQDVERHKAEARADSVVTWDELGGELGLASVMNGFYQRTLDEIGGRLDRRKLTALCELGLITSQGRRLSLEESDIGARFGLGPEILAKLVDRRLLRREPRVGSNYYELSHDTLVGPVVQDRAERAARKARRRLMGIAAAAALGLVLAMVGVWFVAEKNAVDSLIFDAQRAIDDRPEDALLRAVEANGRSARFRRWSHEPSVEAQQTLAAALAQSRAASVLDLGQRPAVGALDSCPAPTAPWRAPAPFAIASSPLDELIAVGGSAGAVWLLDFRGAVVRCTPAPSPGPVSAVTWSPRGHLIASVGGDRVPRVWSLRGEPIGDGLPPVPGTAAVQALALDPEGQLLAVATDRGDVHIGDVTTRSWVRTERTVHLPTDAPGPTVRNLVFLANRSLLTVGADGRVLLLPCIGTGDAPCAPSRDAARILRPVDHGDGALAVDARGHVAAFLAHGRLHVSTGGGKRSRQIPAPGARAVAVDAQGTWIAYADEVSVTVIERESLLTGQPGVGTTLVLPMPEHTPASIALGARGEILYVADAQGGLRGWDLVPKRDGSAARLLDLPAGLRGVFAPSADGSVLIAAHSRESPQGGVSVWEALAPPGEWTDIDSGPADAVATDGAIALVASGARLSLFRRPTSARHGPFALVWTQDLQGGSVSSLRLDPTGRQVAVLLADGIVEVRDTETGAIVERFDDVIVQPSVVRFTPGGLVLGEPGGRLIALGTQTSVQGGPRRRPYELRSDLRAPGLATADRSGDGLVLAAADIGLRELDGAGDLRREGSTASGPRSAPRLLAGGATGAKLVVAREDGSVSLADSVAATEHPLLGLRSAPQHLSVANLGRSALAYSAMVHRGPASTEPVVEAVIFDLRPDGAQGRPSGVQAETLRFQAADPSARWLVSSDVASQVHLWDGGSGFALGHASACHGSTVRAASGAPDGSGVAVGCEDGRLEFLDPLLEPIETVDVGESIEALVWSGPATLWAGTEGGAVLRFDGRQRVGTPWAVGSGPISVLAAGPEGQVAAGSGGGALSIRAGADEPPLEVPDRIDASVSGVAFSSDGKLLAEVVAGHGIRLWSVGDGAVERLGEPSTRLSGTVVSVGFAAGDSVVFASDPEGRLHRWRVSDGQLLGQTAASGAVLHAWPRPDGTIGGASGGSFGGVFAASWGDLLDRACARLAHRRELHTPSSARDALAHWTCDELARDQAASRPGSARIARSYTPLMELAALGQPGAVVALLDAGVDPSQPEQARGEELAIGDTALHLAAGSGRAEIVRELLDRGADPDAANALGVTPLMRAAWVGQLDAARLLLDADGDADSRIHARDVVGSDALMRAAMTGRASVVTYLVGRSARLTDENQMHLQAKDLARIRRQGLNNTFYRLDVTTPPVPRPRFYGLTTDRLWSDLDQLVPALWQQTGAEGPKCLADARPAQLREWMSGTPSESSRAFSACLLEDAKDEQNTYGTGDLSSTLIGLALWHGWGVEPAPRDARLHLTNAAYHGYPLGRLAAGLARWDMMGGPPEPEERYPFWDIGFGFQLIREAAGHVADGWSPSSTISLVRPGEPAAGPIELRALAVSGIVIYHGAPGAAPDRQKGCALVNAAASVGDALALTWRAEEVGEARCGDTTADDSMADWETLVGDGDRAYTPALVERATWCLTTQSRLPACATAVADLERARSAGHATASCPLARVYLHGLGGAAASVPRAVPLLDACARASDPWAATMLGWLVEHEKVEPAEAAVCRSDGGGGSGGPGSTGDRQLTALRCYKLGAAGANEAAIHRLQAALRLP